MTSTTAQHRAAEGIVIRPARSDDLPAVADIYRHYVENTVATFDYVAPGLVDWQAKWELISAAGRPFVVAVAAAPDGTESEVLGFAYLGAFRGMPAYDWTTEDTIYVRPGSGGRGIGSALLGRIVDDADPGSVRQIIAVIAATGGEASVALHTRHGFVEAGRLRNVGFKADEWIDCIYMQLEIH